MLRAAASRFTRRVAAPRVAQRAGSAFADIELPEKLPKTGTWVGGELGQATKAVHSGVAPDEKTGAVITPVYLSTTFVQDSVEEYLAKGFSYSRSGNPTVRSLEQKIAAMENGYGATAVGTGMAATTNCISATMK